MSPAIVASASRRIRASPLEARASAKPIPSGNGNFSGKSGGSPKPPNFGSKSPLSAAAIFDEAASAAPASGATRSGMGRPASSARTASILA